MKVDLTVDNLRTLLTHAREMGTTDQWCTLAIKWIDEANKEIVTLDAQLQTLRDDMREKDLMFKLQDM